MAAIDPASFKHPTCVECIKRQMAKYKNFVGEHGRLYNTFSVPCMGIPENYLSKKWLATLNDKEKEEAIAILDPVTWAKKYIRLPDGQPWVARWYQEQMLRCTSRRKVSRCGRRVGKCLAEGTPIMTPAGAVEIQKLKPGDIVYSYDVKTNRTIEVPVKEVHDRGMQEVVDLTNHNKIMATSTLEHRWHTTHERGARSVKQVKDFYKGIGITRRFIDVPMGDICEEHAYAIGALLGDGCSKEKGLKIYISSEDSKIPNKVASILGCIAKKNQGGNFTWTIGYPDEDGVEIKCHHYSEWCNDRYAHEKICDIEVIRTWNRDSCLALMAGLLDTDGCTQIVDGCLELSWGMQSWETINTLKCLLLDLFQYNAHIGIDNRAKYKNGPVYYIKVKNNLFSKRILRQLDKHLVVDRKKWKQIYSDLNENNSNPNYCGVKIGETRLEHCWDISIDTPDHLYLTANGLVSHNSDAIAVDILHSCFTHQNMRVLIVAPRKAHVEEVIGRIRDFLRANTELFNAVARDVSSPYYEIEFYNGSRIRGFSSGCSSGADAVGVRGQDADRIYLDEADYLISGDLKAITAILITTPSVQLWASSTPTGKRQHFYNWCRNTPTYREFYFPSMVIPFWDQIREDTELEYAGKPDDWTHEVLAEFGENTVGVFQVAYVERATVEYKYEETPPQTGWIYAVGVDWNNDVGTEIVVVGYDNHGGFQVVDAVNVPKQESTQLKGIEAVISINEKWKPAFLYVDAGYGATNIELLRKYGHDIAATDPANPGCNLADRLRAYDFGRKVELHDPTTLQPIEKDAKPLLVENAVRRFEEGTIRISAFDALLIQQLENYIIDHRSPTGRPTYGTIDKKIGDHRLDAFMLALIGFKLEMSDFAHPVYTSRVGIVPGFANPRSNTTVPSPAKVPNHPVDRYDLEDLIFTSNLPARPATHKTRICSKEAWETGREEEFRRKWEIQQMKKRLLRRRHLPERKNI